MNPSRAELITQEIYSSEKRYSRDLLIFLQVFIRPLIRHSKHKNTACITPVEAAVLENSFEKIYETSKEILVELEKGLSIGQVFCLKSEQLRKSYFPFVAGYPAAISLHGDLLNRKKKSNSPISYAGFLRNCMDGNENLLNGRRFTDFLVLPIQRIPRYRLLIKELLRKTTLKFDRIALKEALKRIAHLAEEMNYRLNQSDIHISVPKRLSFIEKQMQKEEEEDEERRKLGGEAEMLMTIEEETASDASSDGGNLAPEDQAVMNYVDTKISKETEEIDDDAPHPFVFGEKQKCIESWIAQVFHNGEESLPTTNPFVLFNLSQAQNPWRNCQIDSLTPGTLMGGLNSLYTSLAENILPYRPQPCDVMVCGPMRGGLNPILYALDCFRKGEIVELNSLVDSVGFLQSHDWSMIPSFMGYRIIKSHSMSLKESLGGSLTVAPHMSRPEWKTIVVLRNPLDVRVSIFRHMRRVFRKLNPEVNFDHVATLDDFSGALFDYEGFIHDLLSVGGLAGNNHSPQLLVVFYEELVSNTAKVLKQIHDFCKFPHSQDHSSLLSAVESKLMNAPEFPRQNHRRGSCGSAKYFSKQSISKIEANWNSLISSSFARVASYEKMYCAVTHEATYPFPAVTPVRAVSSKKKGSSGGGDDSEKETSRTTRAGTMEGFGRTIRAGSHNFFEGLFESRTSNLTPRGSSFSFFGGGRKASNSIDSESSEEKGVVTTGGHLTRTASYVSKFISAGGSSGNMKTETNAEKVDPDDSDDEHQELWIG